MGYDTTRPAWPAPYDAAWSAFEAGSPGLPGRMAAYDAIAERCQPRAPHYYLGVIGVHPSMQGRGAGRILLDAFCRLSVADPLSRGVYLDTSNANSLKFYEKNGFTRAGEGDLDGRPLWCVFRQN